MSTSIRYNSCNRISNVHSIISLTLSMENCLKNTCEYPLDRRTFVLCIFHRGFLSDISKI